MSEYNDNLSNFPLRGRINVNLTAGNFKKNVPIDEEYNLKQSQNNIQKNDKNEILLKNSNKNTTYVNKNLSYKDEKSNQNSILNKNFFKKEKEENTTFEQSNQNLSFPEKSTIGNLLERNIIKNAPIDEESNLKQTQNNNNQNSIVSKFLLKKDKEENKTAEQFKQNLILKKQFLKEDKLLKLTKEDKTKTLQNLEKSKFESLKPLNNLKNYSNNLESSSQINSNREINDIKNKLIETYKKYCDNQFILKEIKNENMNINTIVQNIDELFQEKNEQIEKYEEKLKVTNDLNDKLNCQINLEKSKNKEQINNHSKIKNNDPKKIFENYDNYNSPELIDLNNKIHEFLKDLKRKFNDFDYNGNLNNCFPTVIKFIENIYNSPELIDLNNKIKEFLKYLKKNFNEFDYNGKPNDCFPTIIQFIENIYEEKSEYKEKSKKYRAKSKQIEAEKLELENDKVKYKNKYQRMRESSKEKQKKIEELEEMNEKKSKIRAQSVKTSELIEKKQNEKKDIFKEEYKNFEKIDLTRTNMHKSTKQNEINLLLNFLPSNYLLVLDSNKDLLKTYNNNKDKIIQISEIFKTADFANYSNKKINEEIIKISQNIPYYRKIKVDGNCFYRAIAFCYLENIFSEEFSFDKYNISKTRIGKLIQQTSGKDFKLEKYHYESNEIKDTRLLLENLYVKLIYFYKQKIINEKIEKNLNSHFDLMKFICDEINKDIDLDLSLVLFVRTLIYMILDKYENNEIPEKYKDFFAVYDIKSLKKKVMDLNIEASDIIIAMSPEALKANINIYVLFVSSTPNNSKRTIQENIQNFKPIDQTDININLFFRPGHYDCAYDIYSVKKYGRNLDFLINQKNDLI